MFAKLTTSSANRAERNDHRRTPIAQKQSALIRGICGDNSDTALRFRTYFQMFVTVPFGSVMAWRVVIIVADATIFRELI